MKTFFSFLNGSLFFLASTSALKMSRKKVGTAAAREEKEKAEVTALAKQQSPSELGTTKPLPFLHGKLGHFQGADEFCITECGLKDPESLNGSPNELNGSPNELNGSPFAVMQKYYTSPKPGESVVSSLLTGLTTNDNNAILSDIEGAKKLLACLNVGFNIINNVKPEFIDYDQNSKYVDQACKLVYENKKIYGIDTDINSAFTKSGTSNSDKDYNYYFQRAKEAYDTFTRKPGRDGSDMLKVENYKISIYEATDCEKLFGKEATEETAKTQEINRKAEEEKIKANSEIEKRSVEQKKYLDERVKEAKKKAKEEGIKDIKTTVTKLDADPEILEFNILVDRLHSRKLLDPDMKDSIKSDPAIREFVRVLKVALPGEFNDLDNGVAQLEREMANILSAVIPKFKLGSIEPLEQLLEHENLNEFYQTPEGKKLKVELENLKGTIKLRAGEPDTGSS